MKICSKCKKEKPLEKFSKDKDRLQSWCKDCVAEYKKEYYKNNKEKVLKCSKEYRENNKEEIAEKQKEYRKNNKEKLADQQKEYYENNKKQILEKKKEYREKNRKEILERKKNHYQKDKEKILEKNKEYRENNKEEIAEKQKEYRENNKEEIAEKKKEYRENNKEEIAEKQKEYRKNNKEKLAEYFKIKYQTDINHKISASLRTRINKAIKNNQKQGSAVRDLGCSIQFLKKYLEQQFQPSMSWDNYGEVWQIDHIVPLKAFDLTDRFQFQAACYYENLQPLSIKDNLRKNGKYRQEHYEEYLEYFKKINKEGN